MNTFTAIPADLPPLPAYDATTHWVAYRGKDWKPEAPVIYGCISEGLTSWSFDWRSKSCPSGGLNRHYIDLVPISYEDPAYRAARRSGLRVLLQASRAERLR